MVSRPGKNKVRRYWDSSCFLVLLNNEEDAPACEYILNEAKRLTTELCISPIVQIEVARPKLEAFASLAVAVNLECDLLETTDQHLLRLDQNIPSTALRICRPGAIGQATLF